MSLDSFSFSVLAPIPVSMCAVPMTYSRHSSLISVEMVEHHSFQILNKVFIVIHR